MRVDDVGSWHYSDHFGIAASQSAVEAPYRHAQQVDPTCSQGGRGALRLGRRTFTIPGRRGNLRYAVLLLAHCHLGLGKLRGRRGELRRRSSSNIEAPSDLNGARAT
jgi:hypothetical protein